MRSDGGTLGTFLLDLDATVLGLPTVLFPALARSVLDRGPAVLGLLYAAPGAGALLGAAFGRALGRVRRRGVTIAAAVTVWGGLIAGVGLVRQLEVVLVLLALAGMADVVSAIQRDTMLQESLPPSLRSRLTALQVAVVEGGPRLGGVEAGVMASLVGTQWSVLTGGLGCIAGALLLTAVLPAFRRYKATPS